MFSVSSYVRFAWLSAVAFMVSMGCSYAQDSVADPSIYCDGDWCEYGLSEDDEGAVYPSDYFLHDSNSLGFEKKEGDAQVSPGDAAGPQFSDLYYFFSRAGSVNLGIVLNGLAESLDYWSAGAYDLVLPAKLLALLGNYGYVSTRMIENVALQDNESIHYLSEANWVALSRLYVYIFKTLELGAINPGVFYRGYKATIPWVGFWLAAYDLQGRIEKLVALDPPLTEKEQAIYHKAESGVVVYGIKMLATTMPFVLTSPTWKNRAYWLSFIAALGFLYEGLATVDK